MRTAFVFIAAFLFSLNLSAQKRNYIWCFGDSAGIDFNDLSNPSTFQSGNDTRGSNCAIADSNGNLLFYASTSYRPLYDSGYINLGAVYNKNHDLMQFGDSLIGRGFFNEITIIPVPGVDSLFYVFNISVTGPTSYYGLYYSVVDLKLNGGLGQVTSKNNLLQNMPQVDCLNAVKHGNGRDWWLIFRRWYPGPMTPNNEFFSYLISPAGITNFNTQYVGFLMKGNGGKITFSSDGNTMIYSNFGGLIEKYDFDRCSGIISNPNTINPQNFISGDTLWASNELSRDNSRLYVSTSNNISYLFQFDLTSTNISSSRQTIWSQSYPINSGGVLKRGPDNKIYFANCYVTGTSGGYPYADSLYNMYNMNLSVINQPDSLGAACNFQPYSFYLGGKRTYWGLPNNPDYDMPALAGSPCDTLTGLNPGPLPKERGAELFLTWVGSWQKLFVNAQGLKGRNVTVEVVDVSGKNLSGCCHAEVRGISQNSYFTKDIFLPNLSAGVYIVRLKTEKEVLAKKFVKQ